MVSRASSNQTESEFIQKIAMRFRLCDISTSCPHKIVLGRCPKSTHSRMRYPASVARRGDAIRGHGSNLNGARCDNFDDVAI
jgi:hypothetical protein